MLKLLRACLSADQSARLLGSRFPYWLMALLLLVSFSASCGKFFPSSDTLVAFSAQNSSGQTVSGVNWSSSNTTVANIGTLTGVASNLTSGTATITAAANGDTGSITLTVQ